MASGQSALLSAMGYKNSSPQRKNNRNESVLQDFSMSPYPAGQKTQSRFPSHHKLRSAQTAGMGQHRPSQRNQENVGALSNHSQSQSLLWGSPSRSATASKTAAAGNKYSVLPQKSHSTSGLGMVSPVPPKFAGPSEQRHQLDLSTNNGSMLMQSEGPLSPIRPTEATQFTNRTLPLNHGLNSTQNTLDISNVAAHSAMAARKRSAAHSAGPAVGGQMVVAQRDRIEHETQITVIGFPPGSAGFIHRKFAAYGTILKSEWKHNALFLEYERKQNAERAMEENAKWITNGNERYMIAVEYAERTAINEQDPDDHDGGGGRFLNVTQLALGANNPGRTGNAYFGRNYNQIERAPDIQTGPTHIFWKVFNFMTSGW